jgi:hypothetical protein
MKIFFPVKVYQQLRAYVECTKYEISGLGKVKLVPEGFIVEEVKIFEQNVSGTDTTLDKKALGKFYDELVQKNEDIGLWKLWWHSHAGMEVFFSKTDDDTIEDFDTETPENNWMLSIVTNIAGDFYCQADIFQPIRCSIRDLVHEIDFSDREIKLNAIDEVTEKVKTQSYAESLAWWKNKKKDKKGQIWVPGKDVLPTQTPSTGDITTIDYLPDGKPVFDLLGDKNDPENFRGPME